MTERGAADKADRKKPGARREKKEKKDKANSTSELEAVGPLFSTAELCAWLVRHGLEEYCSKFQEHAITG